MSKNIKVENIRTNTVFALVTGTTRTPAAVTRKNGVYLLVTNPGLSNRTSVEMRRDDRLDVDYAATGVMVPVCGKNEGHGAFVVVGTGTTYCRPCDLATQKASRDRIKAAQVAAAAEGADAILDRTDAVRRVAAAKVDRLMAMLAANGNTLAQIDARNAAKPA